MVKKCSPSELSGVVDSLFTGTSRGADHAPEISEKTDVRARSLRAASLARPTQSLIHAPHKLRMSLFFLRNLIPIALIPFGIVAGVDLLSVLLVRRWAKRSGWGVRHQLALVSGVMGVFIVASPFFEFVIPRQPGHNPTGLTLVDLCALGGLIWLAWRVKRQEGFMSVGVQCRCSICNITSNIENYSSV